MRGESSEYTRSYARQIELAKALLDDFILGGELRNILRKRGLTATPENVLRVGSSAYKGVAFYNDAEQYYCKLNAAGYAHGPGLVVAAVTGARVKHEVQSESLLMLKSGGELVYKSAEELVFRKFKVIKYVRSRSPLRFLKDSAQDVIDGVKGTVLIIMAGETYLKADDMGYVAARSLCQMTKYPIEIITAPTLNEVVIEKPNGDLQEIGPKSSDSERNLLKSTVEASPHLSRSEKNEFKQSFNLEVWASDTLKDILGLSSAVEVDPKGIALLAHPNKVTVVGLNKWDKKSKTVERYDVLIQRESKGKKAEERKAEEGQELFLDVNWQGANINLPPKDSRRNSLLAGITDPSKGNFKLLDRNGRLIPPMPPSAHTEEKDNTIHLSDEERAILERIDANVTVTLKNGKKIGVSQYIVNYFTHRDEQEKKRAAELAEIEFQESIASTMIAVGTFCNNKGLLKTGHAWSYLVQLGALIPSIQSGNPASVLKAIQLGLGLIDLFRKKEVVDPNEIIFRQMTTISKQIESLHARMVEGFIDIEIGLRNISRLLFEHFQVVYLEVYINRLFINNKLTKIQTSMHQLSLQFNKQIYGLWLSSLMDASAAIKHYKTRYGTLSTLPKTRFEKFEAIADALSTWFLEKFTDRNSTGRHLYYTKCSARKVLTVLNESDNVNNIIGFLTAYASDELGVSLHASEPGNPDIWLFAAKLYDELMDQTPEAFLHYYDPNGAQYKRLIQSGSALLVFYQSVQSHSDLFKELLDRYGTTLSYVNRQINNVLASLVEQTVGNKVKEASQAETNELSRHTPEFQYPCRSGIQVNSRERSGFRSIIQNWDERIANTIVPEFFKQYAEMLKEELSRGDIDKPLTSFIKSERYGYLLPISILYKGINNFSETFALLLLAEKLGLGQLIFDIPYDFEIAKQDDWSQPMVVPPIKIPSKVQFQLNNDDKPVTVAQFELDATNKPYAVNQIIAAACISTQPLYGGEYGHDFYDIAWKALNRVAFIGMWLNAKIDKFALECTSIGTRSIEAIEAKVEKRLKENEAKNLSTIVGDLESGVPSTRSEISRYGLVSETFKEAIDQHELSHKLLLSYANLAGLSDSVLEIIEQLWDTNYIILLLHYLIGLNQTPTGVSELEISTTVNTFEKALTIHLAEFDDGTSASPHALLPAGSSSYLKASEMIDEALASAKSAPDSYPHPKKNLILNFLRQLIRQEKLERLGVTLEPEFMEALSWPKNKKIKPKSTEQLAYEDYEIEKLLAFYFESDDQMMPIKATVLPAHCPKAIVPSYLINIFEDHLRGLLRQSEKASQQIIIPTYLRHLGDIEFLWVLLLIITDKQQGSIVIFLDPTGNGQDNQKSITLDLSQEFKKEDDNQTSLFVNRIRTILQEEKHEVNRFVVTGFRQITAQKDFHQSGPLLIENVLYLMSVTGGLLPRPSLSLVQEIRESHKIWIKFIKRYYPTLHAQPMDTPPFLAIEPAIISDEIVEEKQPEKNSLQIAFKACLDRDLQMLKQVVVDESEVKSHARHPYHSASLLQVALIITHVPKRQGNLVEVQKVNYDLALIQFLIDDLCKNNTFLEILTNPIECKPSEKRSAWAQYYDDRILSLDQYSESDSRYCYTYLNTKLANYIQNQPQIAGQTAAPSQWRYLNNSNVQTSIVNLSQTIVMIHKAVAQQLDIHLKRFSIKVEYIESSNNLHLSRAIHPAYQRHLQASALLKFLYKTFSTIQDINVKSFIEDLIANREGLFLQPAPAAPVEIPKTKPATNPVIAPLTQLIDSGFPERKLHVQKFTLAKRYFKFIESNYDRIDGTYCKEIFYKALSLIGKALSRGYDEPMTFLIGFAVPITSQSISKERIMSLFSIVQDITADVSQPILLALFHQKIGTSEALQRALICYDEALQLCPKDKKSILVQTQALIRQQLSKQSPQVYSKSTSLFAAPSSSSSSSSSSPSPQRNLLGNHPRLLAKYPL